MACTAARSPHRGPAFVDIPLDVFGPGAAEGVVVDDAALRGADPDPGALQQIAALVASSERPVLLAPLLELAVHLLGLELQRIAEHRDAARSGQVFETAQCEGGVHRRRPILPRRQRKVSMRSSPKNGSPSMTKVGTPH